MKHVLLMNVRNRKDLTKKCLETMSGTLFEKEDVDLYVVDAALPKEEPLDLEEMRSWVNLHRQGYPSIGHLQLLSAPLCTMSGGLNLGFAAIRDHHQTQTEEHSIAVWVVNNDIIFLKHGWLNILKSRMEEPGTGMVGSSAMSVFGHPFVTGAIWGINLGTAFDVSPDGNIMEPEMCYAYSDVALSIRVAKTGKVVTHVYGVELGDNPTIQHLVSQTVYAREGYDKVMELRREEGKRFIDKYGRNDGNKNLYEGI